MRSCPLVEWFEFNNRCSIKTCKNWSAVTEHRCLEIDRVKTDSTTKIISDAEIHLFKIEKDKVTTRWVSVKRKEAENRIKYLILLKKYIEYIAGKYKEGNVTITEYSRKKLGKYPFSVKEIELKEWMLPFLVNEDIFRQFTKGFKGECNEIKLATILNIQPKHFEKIKRGITHEY